MIRGRRKHRRKRVPWPYSVLSEESGQVMPVAVVALAILFLISMLIIVVGIGELRVTTLAKDSLRAYRVAEAGVNRAMNELRSDAALTSPTTSNPNELNWPNQALSGTPPLPTSVNVQTFGGGTYEVWLYQDPDYPTDHSKKVIVSYGEITSSGNTVSRTIETSVNFAAEDPNMFDAFNFLVYQGDQDEDGGDTFEVNNYFGSYELDGIGDAGDGWGIYAKGPIQLNTHVFAWDANVQGNLISEDQVELGAVASLAPLDVHGTVYAGIDGDGYCDVYSNVNVFLIGDMYIGKIYAADNVKLETIFNFGPAFEGALRVDKGIECGGSVDILGVASGSPWGGGMNIGHWDQGPEDGIRARGGVEADAWITDINIGDIECGYDVDAGNRMGVNFDAALAGTINAGNVKSVGYVSCLGVLGGISTHDIWAGVQRNDGNIEDSLSVDASGIGGGFSAHDIVGRGRVNLVAGLGGFGVDNIWAGYQTVGGQRRGVDFLAIAGGYGAGDIYSFGEVDADIWVGGAGMGNIYAGTDAVSGKGGTGVDIIVAAGGAGASDIKCRGKCDIDMYVAGAGIDDVIAGTDNDSGHGGTGIEFEAWVGGGSMDDGTCVGKFKATAVIGGAGIGDITSGTDSPTLVGGMGTGGDGVSLVTVAGGITTGNINCRGRCPLIPVLGFITTGNIVAGTDAVSGNGGTGVTIPSPLNVVTTGSITSRGMVNIVCALNVVTVGGTITAGTNSATARNNKLVGGTGVSIVGAAAVPSLGAIISHGRVNIATGGTWMNIGGSIQAGTDSTNNDNEYGGTGVSISTGAGYISVAGGITSRGMVDLWALLAYIDVNGRVNAGTNNTGGTGGTGVDIDPIAGEVEASGITSRGRCDMQAIGAGIDINGTMVIGTDSTTGWGGTGIDADSILGIIDVSSLTTSRGVVSVQSTASFGCDFAGIYAGGTNTGNGYGGQGIYIRAYAAGVDIDGGGSLKTPGKIYLDTIAGSIDVDGDVIGGSNSDSSPPIAGGTGVHLHPRVANINVGGWVKSTGKTHLDLSGIGGSFSSCTVNAIHAGSDNGLTSGRGIHHDMGGIFNTTRINNAWYVGYLDYDTGDTSEFHIGNQWTGHNIDFNVGTWSGLNHNVVVLEGYAHTPGYVYCRGSGLGVNLSGGIECGGNVIMYPEASWLPFVGKEFDVGNIYTPATVTLQPVHEGSKDNIVDVSGLIRCNTLSLHANYEVIKLWGGLQTRTSLTVDADHGHDVFWYGDYIYIDGTVTVGGNLAMYCRYDLFQIDPRLDIHNSTLQATGTVTINPDENHEMYVNNATIQANGSVAVYARDADGNLNFSWVRSRGNITVRVYNGGGGEFDIDGIWANGTVNVDCDDAEPFQGGIKGRGSVTVDIADDGWYVSSGINSNSWVNFHANGTGYISGGVTAIASGSNIDFDKGYSYISGEVRCAGPFNIDFNSANNNDYNKRLALLNGVRTTNGGTVTFGAYREDQNCSSFLNCCTGIYPDHDYEWIRVDGGYPTSYSRTTAYNRGGRCTQKWAWYGCKSCTTSSQFRKGGTYLYGGTLGNEAAASVATVGSISTPTAYSYGHGQPSIPVCPDPTADLGITLPGNPSIHSSVNNIYVATSGQEDLALEPEPAMPTFGHATYPYFPDQTQASADLPAWMGYSCNPAVDHASSAGTTGLIPDMPEHPEWNGLDAPDWGSLLPFGVGNVVKFPTPQWDWWREEAISQGNYYPGDVALTINSNCNDEIFFAEGNVTINAMDFFSNAIQNKATIVAYGNGITGQGDINISTSADWVIFSDDELHLMAHDDVNLDPASLAGSLSIAVNSYYQFWAGDEIHVALPFLSGILGSGGVKGNFVAGNKVNLTDEDWGWLGWYQFSYARPEIKADGWVIPFRTRSWRELTKANWK